MLVLPFSQGASHLYAAMLVGGNRQESAACGYAGLMLVLVAALPSASNVSVLAERFGADNGRIARIILVSTAAAFLTFSGAVRLLT